MSAPVAGKKKKGLSQDEKKEVMLSIMHNSKDVCNLKELEKLGAKAGVVEKTVKEIIEILVSEHKVEVEKIGSGNFFWSFPSKAFIGIKNQSDALVQQATSETKAVAELEAKVAAVAAAKSDSAGRADKLQELSALKAEKEELDRKLRNYADSDPDALKDMAKKAVKAKECANRWTDGVWALKGYLVDKYNKSPHECDAMIGIHDDFDYMN